MGLAARSGRNLALALVALSIVVTAFLIDWLVPAHINVGVFHAVAVMIAGMGRSVRLVGAVAALSLVLLAAAVFLAPHSAGTNMPGLIGLNRTLTALTILVIAGLSWLLVRRTTALVAAREQLARQVDDRTQRLAAEKRSRAEAEERLRHASRIEALGRLTSEVAHDFRNLMTAVVGNLDLLRRRLADQPRLLNYVAGAEQGARRAVEQAERLLSHARRRSLEPEAIDVAVLFAELGAVLQQAVGPNVMVCFDVQEGLQVWADRRQLELVLLNLCINARDAMPSGGEIAVVAERGAAHPAEVIIRVRDSGHGMDAQTLARAVEPFFTTKPDRLGTGLGLAMAHEFAIASNGRMEIESTPGAGTTVTIHLMVPVAQQVLGSGGKG